MKNLILILALFIEVAQAKYTIYTNDIAIGDNVKPEDGLAFSVQTTLKSSIPCPKMTEVQRDALAVSQTGSCIFNTDSFKYEIYNGATWLEIGGGGGLSKWTTGVSYGIGDVIYDELSNRIYRAIVAHTAGATFAGDIANWQELSETYLTEEEALLQKLEVSTGLVDGGQLSVGTPTSTFSIAAGFGYVVDTATDIENPTNVRVNWTAQSNVALTDISANFTAIGINSAGAIVQKVGSFFTAEELRDYIALGVAVHISHAQIDSITHNPRMASSSGSSIQDLASSIGSINRLGNVYSANGANLNIDKTAGETHALGTNYAVNPKSPNIRIDTAGTLISFAPVYRDGSGGTSVGSPSTTVNPTLWDDGTGTPATVNNNKWTIQRIYYASSTSGTFIAYGQEVYSNLESAKNGIITEAFETPPELLGSSLRGWLIVKESASDLSDLSDATFVAADKFGSSPASGGSPSLGDFQSVYDNSNQPHVVLDGVRGGLQITDAATPIAAPFFEVMSNDTLTTYFGVDAEKVSISGRVSQTGLGGSTLFGEDAGLNDDFSSNDLTAFGAHALEATTTGIKNTAIGNYALAANTTSNYNTAVGFEAMLANTTGNNNTAIGYRSLSRTTALSLSNTAVGYNSALRVTSGDHNVVMGAASGEYITSGIGNVMLGSGSGISNSTGSNNTFIGYRAGSGSGSNSGNIFIGYDTARNVTTGSNNIVLGYDIDLPTATTSNYLSLGNLITGDTVAKTTSIDGSLTVNSTTSASTPCPSMTEAQRDALTPSAGECVYNSTSAAQEFYNGTIWASGSGGSGIPIMDKGSIVASNGTANGEFAKCADGEILEWDSTEDAGFKCETKPASPSPVNYEISPLVYKETTSGTFVDVVGASVTITTTGGPVRVEIINGDLSRLSNSGTGAALMQIERDGTTSLGRIRSDNTSVQQTHVGTAWIDEVPAGTYTYQLQLSSSLGTSAIYTRFMVSEMK